jgi:hypothetical protein
LPEIERSTAEVKTANRSQAKISEHVSRQHNQDKNGQSSASAINQTYSGYMVK